MFLNGSIGSLMCKYRYKIWLFTKEIADSKICISSKQIVPCLYPLVCSTNKPSSWVLKAHSCAQSHVAYSFPRQSFFTAYLFGTFACGMCRCGLRHCCIAFYCNWLVQSTSCRYLDRFCLSTIMNVNVHFLRLVP